MASLDWHPFEPRAKARKAEGRSPTIGSRPNATAARLVATNKEPDQGKRTADWTQNLTTVTAALVLVGLFQLGASLLQWDAMGRQLEESVKAREQDKKALKIAKGALKQAKIANNISDNAQKLAFSSALLTKQIDAIASYLAALDDFHSKFDFELDRIRYSSAAIPSAAVNVLATQSSARVTQTYNQLTMVSPKDISAIAENMYSNFRTEMTLLHEVGGNCPDSNNVPPMALLMCQQHKSYLLEKREETRKAEIEVTVRLDEKRAPHYTLTDRGILVRCANKFAHSSTPVTDESWHICIAANRGEFVPPSHSGIVAP